MKNFHDLFVHELRDIYSAEVKIEKAMPEFIKAAHHQELKDAIRKHHEETERQIMRLRKIAAELDVELTGGECDAITGILKEIRKSLTEQYVPDVHDALLICSLQRIEHYEIAVYGALKAFAKRLKLHEVEKLLQESSKEEGHADKKLTEIANGKFFSAGLNDKAIKRKIA
jgi:ferritin-like metal-binding protein YciE